MPLSKLLDNNKRWAQNIKEKNPEFFNTLSKQQAPKYLWIGCSDSRVPANEVVGMLPGELFVHRNVANVVVHTDHNCLSVLQYAIEVLKVEHVLVCGHYGCGGVIAALNKLRFGLIDNWLRHIKDIIGRYGDHLNSLETQPQKEERLCELNVIEQVINVCHTNVVQDAWYRGQKVSVHGVIYGLKDGILTDLGVNIGAKEEMNSKYIQALNTLGIGVTDPTQLPKLVL